MIRAFFSSSALIFVGLVCAFLSHITLAKVLGASEYGVYSFIFSVSLLISVFGLFGFQNASVKIISLFQGGKNRDHTISFCRFSLLFCVGITVCMAVLVYGLFWVTPLADEYPKNAFLIGILASILMVFMRLHAAFLRGLSKPVLSVLFETSLREILLVLGVFALLLIGFDIETGVQALLILIGALSISSFFAWVISVIEINKKNLAPSRAIEKSQKKEWLALSFPMMLTIFAQRLLRRSDIIMLGVMTSPVIVGAYAIAAQFAESSTIGQKAVYAIFSPKVATLHDEGKKGELKKFYSQIQWISILSTGAICLAIGLVTPFILGFFGQGFEGAYMPIIILLVGQFLNICFGPVALLMLMTGREKQAMTATFIAAIANLILNPVAIYFYGMEGAAVTTASLLILRAAANYYDVKKQGIL